MKKAHFHLAILLLFFTNLATAQYILTLNFEEMDPYIGKRLVTRVVETSTGKEVGRRTIDAVENSDFSFDLYVLLEGRSYTIDYYVDVNASGDYDAPPTDHAWRRTLNNATQHTTMTFIPDKNFTDTGLPDPFPYSIYDAVWGGKWHNLTFGSTDSIEATFQMTCDSFYGYFTTAGVFGNPAQVEFDTSGVLPDDEGGLDTIIFHLDPPWTGQITIFNGEIHADLMQAGIGLHFTGTIGAKQILALYTVIVAGNPFANGYFYIRELDINSSTPELMIELNANAEVTCFDGDDGFLSTEAVGGMPGYTYSWSNGDTTALISNLVAGDYSVTVTDVLGCTAEMIYSVSQPAQLVTTWFTDQVSCIGLCDGSIDIIMTGGVPPYFFSWSTGSTTEDLFGLCAGTYMLTVTDAVGCVASAPITIFEPDPLNVVVETTGAACFGSCSGTITHTVVTGGVPPYNFMDQTGLCAGDYITFVIDANGCQFSTPVTILEPDSLIINVYLFPAATGQADGAIELEAFGGTPPYQYSLNGGPFTSSSIFLNLATGFYTPSVQDANGCITEIEVFLPELTAVAELEAKYKLYPNPTSSWINLESDIPLEIDVLDIHGQFIRHEEKSGIHRIQVADFVPGVYLLKISDGVGKVYMKLVIQ